MGIATELAGGSPLPRGEFEKDIDKKVAPIQTKLSDYFHRSNMGKKILCKSSENFFDLLELSAKFYDMNCPFINGRNLNNQFVLREK